MKANINGTSLSSDASKNSLFGLIINSLCTSIDGWSPCLLGAYVTFLKKTKMKKKAERVSEWVNWIELKQKKEKKFKRIFQLKNQNEIILIERKEIDIPNRQTYGISLLWFGIGIFAYERFQLIIDTARFAGVTRGRLKSHRCRTIRRKLYSAKY